MNFIVGLFAFIGLLVVVILIVVFVINSFNELMNSFPKWAERNRVVSYLENQGHRDIAREIRNGKHLESSES